MLYAWCLTLNKAYSNEITMLGTRVLAVSLRILTHVGFSAGERYCELLENFGWAKLATKPRSRLIE